jgi:LPXTG-motif cell wall-anchored protein
MGIFTAQGRDELSFQIFASIPAEELTFRGMFYFLIYYLAREIIFDVKSIPENDRDERRYSKVNEWAAFISIIITGIAFGMYHLTRYGFDLSVIIYLSILGIILGIVCYKHSIFAAYLLHVANNIGAEKEALFIDPNSSISILANPYVILVIGLAILGIIAIFLYLKKRKQVKN